MRKAIIVFSDNSGVWWLEFLKPGFRHCFVILETDRGCLWVDPLSSGLTIKQLAGYEMKALLEGYRNMGMKVVETQAVAPSSSAFPISLFSCVEVIKRLLGVKSLSVQTPWQLYQHLKRTNNEYIGKNSLTFQA